VRSLTRRAPHRHILGRSERSSPALHVFDQLAIAIAPRTRKSLTDVAYTLSDCRCWVSPPLEAVPNGTSSLDQLHRVPHYVLRHIAIKRRSRLDNRRMCSPPRSPQISIAINPSKCSQTPLNAVKIESVWQFGAASSGAA
jgi:hypothetical protein